MIVRIPTLLMILKQLSVLFLADTTCTKIGDFDIKLQKILGALLPDSILCKGYSTSPQTTT